MKTSIYPKTEQITDFKNPPKKRFTWTFRAFDENKNLIVPDVIVKVVARPQIDFEETEINFLSGKMWIPGKTSWESIFVNFVEYPSDLADEIEKQIPSMNIIELVLLDGRYRPLEIWRLPLEGKEHFCVSSRLQNCLTTMNICFRYSQTQYIACTPEYDITQVESFGLKEKQCHA